MEAERKQTSDTAMDTDDEDDQDIRQPDAEDEADSQDPESPLEAFDWHDLDERYQRMVQERDIVEDGLMSEFKELVEVSLDLPWAQSGTNISLVFRALGSDEQES
jgi:hypothetical protein